MEHANMRSCIASTIQRRRCVSGVSMGDESLNSRQKLLLNPNTDLGFEAAKDLSIELNALLADMFVLHMKTKNFHWHVSGPHFRDYQALLDEQAQQLYAATDVIAKRVRMIGANTLRSISDISRRQRLPDNDAECVSPLEMLTELHGDNRQLAAYLRETHGVCEEHGDVASASLIETWIDEAERRIWQLFEVSRFT
jgi:starvation-inducible DNA-binding protein